jgi:hypothetical protein
MLDERNKILKQNKNKQTNKHKKQNTFCEQPSRPMDKVSPVVLKNKYQHLYTAVAVATNNQFDFQHLLAGCWDMTVTKKNCYCYYYM